MVGIEARKDLEKFFGKQVHLELYVKVNKDLQQPQPATPVWVPKLTLKRLPHKPMQFCISSFPACFIRPAK